MASNQNFLPKDLRPINVGRTIAEESSVLPAATTGRNPDSYPPNSVASRSGAPVFYTATISDPGFVSLGYGNAAGTGAAAAWCSHMPVQIGHPVVSHPAIGYGYTQNMGNWVGDGNGADHATGTVYASNLSNFADSNVVDHAGSDMGSTVASTPSLSTRARGNATDQTGVVQTNWAASSNNTANRMSANGVDQINDEGDDSVLGKKIKFLCSFGGKILPRPSDGMLRYVGGHTRIISVRRDVSYNELVQKMANTYGQVTVIKYQLPDEDLDALVSISCPDDLDNMMEEYEKLVERTSDSSAKLRVFLFSPSEVDPSGMAQFVDLQDSGQKYVNAVNEFAVGFGGDPTRRGSMTSAASTQNTEFSCSEAPEHSVYSQGDNIKAAPSPSMLSPKENAPTSHNNSAKAEAVKPTTTVYSDVSGIHVGITGIKTGLTKASPVQSEIETERSVPLTSTQHMGWPQSSAEVPLPASYLNLFAPNPEVMNHAEYIQFPPQVGLTNCQRLGNGGSVFTQQQIYENTNPSNHFIPAMQVPVTSPSSHASMRPNTIRPSAQPQQNQLDPYAHESTFSSRIVQLPAEHSYYHVQVPSSVVGSGYGWHHTLPTEHASFRDVMVAHQQERIPEKTTRLEDCLMCQKALPHAHSDTVVQDKRDSDPSSDPNITPFFHSVHLGDRTVSPAINGVMRTAPLGESIIEQGVRTQPRVTSNVDSLVSAHTDTSGQAYRTQEGERSFIQKPDVSDHHQNAVDMVGRVGDVHSSHGPLLCTMPQSNQDDALRKIILPSEIFFKGDSLATKPMVDDMSPPGKTRKMTEHVALESPKAHANRLPEIVSRSEVADHHFTYDQLKPIDGRMEMLQIHNPEGCVHNEHSNLPFDNTTRGDNSFFLPNQVVGKEMFLDDEYGRSKMVSEANQLKATELLPSSSAGVPFVHISKPMESNELGTSVWGNPFSYSQSMIGNHPLDCNCVKPSLYGVDPTNISVHPDDWSNHVARFDKATTSAAEVLSSSGNISNAISPFGRPGDVQENSSSLFSDKELWNLQCNNYYPPPRPSKVQLHKEPVICVDPFRDDKQLGKHGDQNLDVKPGDGFFQSLPSSKQDLSTEHSLSAKGSAEEKIKQELQAVAEGVAASVFCSSVPSSTDLLERNDSSKEEIEVDNVQNIAPDKQHKDSIQDASTTSEKVQLGLPKLDGIGRLQIIKNSDLEELRELGSGTFGTVYHGKWRGTDVAIKRINDRCFAGKPSEQERMRDDFWNEAIKLADLHHPNVVAFYGVVLDGTGGSVATVTEYMVNGSLRTALLKNRRSLDMRKRLVITMDVAFGMEYLHGKNIVHFDLKSDNLLVNLRDPHRPICKVGDLGLSKVKCQTLISGGVRGTLPWMAPELLSGSSSLVSEKVDVFSFGIVMWELLTGEEPYADLHYGAIIGGIVSNTLRPPVPESCDADWRSLMERCWSPEPPLRPSFTEIVNELRTMAAKIPPKSQNLQHHPPSLQTQVLN